tara:strand:- start:297 stop:770 length:474 start_codon:yes stop_codon:yes gene_type:complete
MTKALIVATLVLVLTSCGFHLRGNLPLSQFPAIFVQSEAHSELAKLLSERLRQNSVQLLDSEQTDAPTIQLINDTLERRTLSLFPSGQVAEYELIYKVSYYLIMPGNEPAFNQFELYRDYQDDPNQALAKARELDLLLSELRQQAANRIIRQLARLD